MEKIDKSVSYKTVSLPTNSLRYPFAKNIVPSVSDNLNKLKIPPTNNIGLSIAFSRPGKN